MEITRTIFMTSLIIITNFYLVHNAIAEKMCTPTEIDVEGPYYLSNAPFRTNIASSEESGQRIAIKGTVLSPDCKTQIKDVLIEIWQTDSKGRYYYKEDNYRLRGQMRTDRNGHYEFQTVKPGRYGLGNGFRPAHIHFKVSHPDYDTVITQLYFKGDPYLWPNDACKVACKSNDPQRIIELKRIQLGEMEYLEGTFNITLKKPER
jgi:catechol 1,2-dioxygenase